MNWPRPLLLHIAVCYMLDVDALMIAIYAWLALSNVEYENLRK